MPSPTWSARAAGVVDVEVPVDTDRTLQAAEAYAYHRERMVTSSPNSTIPKPCGVCAPARESPTSNTERLNANWRAFAQRNRENVRESIDLLLTPTTPIPAPHIADLTANLDQLRPTELLLLRNTRPANVWGLPAISVPCGLTTEGLPIGLQIIGPMGRRRQSAAAGIGVRAVARKRSPTLSRTECTSSGNVITNSH